VENLFQANMFSFFLLKMGIISEDLIVTRTLFQFVDAATEKA